LLEPFDLVFKRPPMTARSIRMALTAGAAALLLAGCSSVQGERLTDPARVATATFFVEHQPKDTRHLDLQIGEALAARGVTVTPRREGAAYLVTYEDRWSWDMRPFLRDLKIEARDAKTGQVVGTGRSRQDSLSAMGKTFRDVIDRAVGAMFDGPPK
jgi:hypothetical protein